jgi:glycosyltransferase involved in cell wall biosynthesis
MFVGSGPKWSLVAEMTDRNYAGTVTVLPWQSEEVFPYCLAAADLALVSLETGMEGMAVPSKGISAIAAGSAILFLGSSHSDMAMWAKKFGFGTVIEPEDLAGKLRELASSLDRLQNHRRRARRTAEEEFSRATNSERIIGILDGLTSVDAR